MRRNRYSIAYFGLSLAALLSWVVMFLAGTDVWHDVGRPDFWHLQGPPYHDLRTFGYAFYLLLIVLSVHTILAARGLRIAPTQDRKTD